MKFIIYSILVLSSFSSSLKSSNNQDREKRHKEVSSYILSLFPDDKEKKQVKIEKKIKFKDIRYEEFCGDGSNENIEKVTGFLEFAINKSLEDNKENLMKSFKDLKSLFSNYISIKYSFSQEFTKAYGVIAK